VLSYHAACFMRNGRFPSIAIQNIQWDTVTAANYSLCLMWNLPQGLLLLRQQHWPGGAHLGTFPFAESPLSSLKPPHTDSAPVVPSPHQRRDSDRYCQLCAAWFNNPMMAQQHYDGKKHKKNAARADLLEQLGKTLDLGELRGEGTGTRRARTCSPCDLVAVVELPVPAAVTVPLVKWCRGGHDALTAL